MSQISRILHHLAIHRPWQKVHDFFFALQTNQTLVAMRIGYGFFLVFYFLNNYAALKMIFGTRGLILMGAPGFNVNLKFAYFFKFFSAPSDDAVLLFSIMSIGFAVLLCLGVGHRIIPIVVWLSVATLTSMVPGNSGDELVQVFATLLVLPGIFGYLGPGMTLSTFRQIPAWPLRLFQIQLALVYFFSGWHKLSNQAWSHGNALHYVSGQSVWSRIDLSWLLNWPELTSLFTYLVLLFELLLFPVLVWHRKCRTTILLLAFSFHLAIYLTMKVFTFHLIMPLYFFSFIDSEKWGLAFSAVRKPS